MPCRNRGVGGEHCGISDQLRGFAVVHPLLDLFSDPLQHGERGMALVQMKDGIILAQSPQYPCPADSQDNLLAQAHLPVAGVEPVGDDPVLRFVGLAGGIYQIELGPSHLNHPDLKCEGRVHDWNLDREWVSIPVQHLVNGRILSVQHLASPNLPAVC